MNIYEKLMHIQSELKAPKSQWNKFGNYYYRSCEDILEGLKPLLTTYKATVILQDEIKLIGDRYYVEATATIVDVEKGDKLEAKALAREDESKKGMDLAQVTGSVSSYARKYALNGLFAIDDTKDSDATNKHGKESKQATQQAPVTQATQGATNGAKALTDKQVKRLYTLASKAGYDHDKTKQMILAKFGKETKDLTKVEYDKVCEGFQAKIDSQQSA